MSSASVIVAVQLEAYNARDIEAFSACWAEDALYYQFPDTLLAQGRADIRARHEIRFQEPDLFGKLISRVTIGSRVIDTEIVTRNFPEGRGEVDVVGIYEVENDLITKVWFMMGSPRF